MSRSLTSSSLGLRTESEEPEFFPRLFALCSAVAYLLGFPFLRNRDRAGDLPSWVPAGLLECVLSPPGSSPVSLVRQFFSGSSPEVGPCVQCELFFRRRHSLQFQRCLFLEEFIKVPPPLMRVIEPRSFSASDLRIRVPELCQERTLSLFAFR